MKNKILFCGHNSNSKTGFGIYTHEVIKRLVQTDKFEVAEFGCHGTIEDRSKVNWKFYPTAVTSGDSRFREYTSKMENYNGAWRFNQILLHFRPDIVCTMLDPNMIKYQMYSPFRKYFHWSVSTTLDGWPQRPEYINMYNNADSLSTYTKWAKNVLDRDYDFKKEVFVIPLGVSEEYTQLDQPSIIKAKYGFNSSDFIIGTVMRNQNRKLIGDLIEGFSLFINQYVGNKTPKLIINTTYPDDLEWDIPYLLNRYNCHKNIYFPYIDSSGRVYYHNFNGIQFNNLEFKKVKSHISNGQMCEMYNMIDLYVQYAKAEGFGIPMYEAVACGTEVIAPDYAAMYEFNNVFNAERINIKFFEKDRTLYRDCGYPDIDHFVHILLKKIESTIPQNDNIKIVKSNYSWDNCANSWIDLFNKVKLKDKQGKWFATARSKDIPKYQKINEMSDAEFVRNLYSTYSLESNDAYSYEALALMNSLEMGSVRSGGLSRKINRDILSSNFFNSLNKQIGLEKTRISPSISEDYLDD